jgi:hypothetical protein
MDNMFDVLTQDIIQHSNYFLGHLDGNIIHLKSGSMYSTISGGAPRAALRASMPWPLHAPARMQWRMPLHAPARGIAARVRLSAAASSCPALHSPAPAPSSRAGWAGTCLCRAGCLWACASLWATARAWHASERRLRAEDQDGTRVAANLLQCRCISVRGTHFYTGPGQPPAPGTPC